MSEKYKKISEQDVFNAFIDFRENHNRGGLLIKDIAEVLQTSNYQAKKYMYILKEKGFLSRAKCGGGSEIINGGDYETACFYVDTCPVTYRWDISNELNMRTRNDVLNEVLDLQREIEERQEEINKLCKEAKGIEDDDDDENEKKGYGSWLSSILSHET